MGRPSLYKPEYCAQLLTHMADGLSFESFGGVVGVGRSTLYNWRDKHKAFRAATEIGEAMSRLYWEKLGRDGLHNETIKDADGMTVTKSINATLWIFNMKNRFGWRDKQPDEEPPPPKPEEKGAKLSPDELIELVKQARGEKA